ncbi:unnamed protein product [Dimorphilus gyrociliatus]|uniref:Uncharacterized protein n=1 Tax=Dimorphilus gyrociliatus TaxID=2664684 RepID=A0A7I8W3T3_9ANNE|nr:unnamed protein product [Dimorphilus gyrociliatus]
MYYYRNHILNNQLIIINNAFGATVKPTDNLCFFKIAAYKNSKYFSQDETIRVYADLDDRLIFLDRLNLEKDWKDFRISLKKLKGKKFRIALYGSIQDNCQSYIGIDHTDYETCPFEREATELKVTDTSFENCQTGCLDIHNRNSEIHNSVWLERLTFNQNHPIIESSSLINIDLHSAYVLVRNLNIPNLNNSHVIQVHFNSTFESRISNLVFTQNSITNLYESSLLRMNNYGINNATVTFDKCNIQHSKSRDYLIYIENADISFTNNLLYNNTAQGNLLYVNSNSSNTNISLNTFIFNKKDPDEGNDAVITSVSRNLYINNNILNNPQTPYEVAYSLQNADFQSGNCQYNWWGSLDIDKLGKRIKDGKSLEGSPILQFVPILQSEPLSLATSGSCVLGWKFIRGSCYHFHVGAGSKAEAEIWCKKNSAFLLTEEALRAVDRLTDLLRYTDVDGNTKVSDIWFTNSPSQLSILKPWICGKSSSELNRGENVTIPVTPYPDETVSV